jgi:hypothetical protein
MLRSNRLQNKSIELFNFRDMEYVKRIYTVLENSDKIQVELVIVSILKTGFK